MVNNGKTGNTAEGDVSQQDMKFIIECLKNLDKNKQVDLVKVGNAMGYTNLMSVSNRFRLLRKRHGFHSLESTTSGRDDDKLSAAVTKTAQETGPATLSSTMTNAGEVAPVSAEEGETSVSVKGQDPSQKTTQRKGAKVSTKKPVPAGASGKRKSASAPKTKGTKARKTKAAPTIDHTEGINAYLLDAVDRVVQEEEQSDAKMHSSHGKA